MIIIRKTTVGLCKTINRHKIVFYKGLSVFNALPVLVQESRSVFSFKNTGENLEMSKNVLINLFDIYVGTAL